MPFVFGEVDVTERGAKPARTLGLGSASSGVLTEAGIGAVVPWADRLYFANYPGESGQATGLGIYSIGRDDARPRLEVETNCTDTGRMIHNPTKKLVIGRHLIDATGTITPITGLNAGDRICGYSLYPLSVTDTICALTMGSSGANRTPRLYTINMTTAVATERLDFAVGGWNSSAHFKSLWAASINLATGVNARLYAANNNPGTGTLVSINPNDWTMTSLTPTLNASWVEVGGAYMANNGDASFAIGVDDKSALLMALDPDPTKAGQLNRLPLPGNSWTQYYQQEWMRIRAVSTERLLMDCHGIWYDLSPFLGGASRTYQGGLPRLRAMSRHYGTYPDFCAYDGALVLATNMTSPQGNAFPASGQPSSGLVFTDLESVTRGARPDGIGYFWKNEAITSGTRSDRMLARGFGQAGLQFTNGTATPVGVDVQIWISNVNWVLTSITVAANASTHYELPVGLAADWISLMPQATVAAFTAIATFS